MAGISSKAASGIQNKYKFNKGNELQSNEFSDGNGLELYDAVNRTYDPQLGRFWQVDELAEANWECSPYFFANNNPILFNDPFGLDPETSTPDKPKQLSEVVIVSYGRMSYWGKMRMLYDLQKRTNGNLNLIQSDYLRYEMQRLEGHLRFREDVANQTRESDKIVLEVAANFIPVGVLTKLRYVKYAANLFKFKRGAQAGYVFYSGGKSAGQEALKFATENGYKIIDNTGMGKALDWLTTKTSYSITEPLWNAASKVFANGASGEIKVFLNLTEANPTGIFFRSELPILEKKGLEIFYKLVQ